jgi:non-ribosomal peptide synthetase component F
VYQGPADGYLAQAGTLVVLAPEYDHDRERLVGLLRAEGIAAEAENAQIVVPVDADAIDDPRALAVVLNRLAFDHDIVLAELAVRRPTLESHYLATVEGDKR